MNSHSKLKIQSSDINLVEFLKSMIQSFENLFVRQNCVDDINSLIELIEEKMPIQPFLDDSSFSSIFLPFHIGTILHNNGEVKFGDIDYINKQLREFCSIAAEIEKRTSGIFAEPTENKKSELKNLLIQFKKLLPSKEVFCDWCASSEKQEKPHPPKAEG